MPDYVPALVHQRVVAQATASPSALALSTAAGDLTFAQLVAAARAIAGALDTARVPRSGHVIIAAGDHALVAAAVIGVLGRGGVVVPVEANVGAERLARMIHRARPAAYVVDTIAARHFASDDGVPRIVRDTPGASETALDASDLDAPCSIYFTSGSTGAPRAILGRAVGIDHHIAWEIDALALDRRTRGAIVHTVGYDAYLPDLLVPLCAGGVAVAPPAEVLADPERFVEWLARAEISLLHCTPSRWRELVATPRARDLAGLRHVVLAGEVVRPADSEITHALLGERVQLWNLYGPTEATLVKLHHRITPADARRERVPIGRPMPGVSVRLVAASGASCAPGEVGEIAIRSRFASLGYVDEPALTASRFHAVGREIEYLTGDLGVADAEGELVFIGRRDRQLKLRGARVDLDEIEAILASCEGVVEAAVVADAEHTAVFGFVVTDGTGAALVRERAAPRLSSAMRVARIERRDALPRTASGKIDRAALQRSLEEPV